MLVILGNQLFAPEHLPPPDSMPVFMAEDMGLCTYEKHHQQKIVLFLAAMRAYADELRAAGYDVHYVNLDTDDTRPYEGKLAAALERAGASQIVHFEIEDKAMEERIIEFARRGGVERDERPSPMFTCSRERFAGFAAGKSRLLGSLERGAIERLTLAMLGDILSADAAWCRRRFCSARREGKPRPPSGQPSSWPSSRCSCATPRPIRPRARKPTTSTA